MEYLVGIISGGLWNLRLVGFIRRRIIRLMRFSIPARESHLILINQKTKGLTLNEEKKTVLSRPERNLDVFRGEWLLMTVLTWAQSSVKSRCGRTKECKSTTRCLSGEKTKLSVNWILLSKSSQQHLALSWTAS